MDDDDERKGYEQSYKAAKMKLEKLEGGTSLPNFDQQELISPSASCPAEGEGNRNSEND